MRGVIALMGGAALAALALGGCQAGSSHAAGSGYGVGAPRAALNIGRPMRASGVTTGIAAPSEQGIGTIKRAPEAWPPGGGSRYPLQWATVWGQTAPNRPRAQ